MTQIGISINSSGNSSPVFSNAVINQVVGSDNQAQVSFKLSGTQTGNVYVRFISGYGGGGKSEIDSGDGFPIVESVAANLSEDFTITSAANLIVGQSYHVCFYWESDDTFTVVPVGNGLEVTGPITITGTIPDPTDIFPNTLSITEGATEGTLIGNLSADVQGATFTEGTPDLTWANLASNGVVTVDTGQTAPTPGNYTLKARATIAGTHSEDITVVVNPVSSGGGGSGTPIPPSDGASAANSGTPYTSVANLLSALSSLNSDWNGTMTGWGLAQSGVEPVLTLEAGSHGALSLSGLDFSSNETVIIRGEGPYSHDGWVPTAGTKIGRLTASNCDNLMVMGMQAEVSSGTVGDINACNDVYFVRVSLNGDPARSSAEAAVRPNTNEAVLFRGGSADSGLKECTVIGGVARQLGDAQATTTRIHVDGCVFDQCSGDNINLPNGVNNSWEVHRNLSGGRNRNPGTLHQDWVQVRADNGLTSTAKYWNCTGNAHINRGYWGTDNNASYQVYFWGGNSLSSEGFFSDNFFVICNGSIKGAHGGATATFNTVLMMTDVLNFEAASYNASQSNMTPTNRDNNIMTKYKINDDNGAGPNGLEIYVPGGHNADDPGVDWGPQNAYTTNPATRTGPLGDLKPVTGTRMHWDHANPTGSYKMLERMFSTDPTKHDHWKDRGWPGACLCHIAYDPANDLGGSSGSYTSFTVDGD